MEKVRCPACRGSKKVPKLGGMIGECNTCVGEGFIEAAEKPVKVAPVTMEDVIARELVHAVADCQPTAVAENDVKVDGKRAVFKRKKV